MDLAILPLIVTLAVALGVGAGFFGARYLPRVPTPAVTRPSPEDAPAAPPSPAPTYEGRLAAVEDAVDRLRRQQAEFVEDCTSILETVETKRRSIAATAAVIKRKRGEAQDDQDEPQDLDARLSNGRGFASEGEHRAAIAAAFRRGRSTP